MAPKKRKASAIESEEGSEEIAWIEKQKLPSGSSPVLWDSKYASSSDEEFEGFFDSSNLFLSDVHKSTSNADVLGFFQDFKCDVVSRDVQKDKKLSFVVRFSSHELAMAALEKYKDVKLEGRTISLTRSTDSRYCFAFFG
ncbi:hypothetical protein ARALYDRAFT_905839 [Arabidopsis lyrata subsp. lyrata]|uniref:RRM domain-containing protein n=1 Tax=Arabidopsis lyrata subsp. lyrata TaxID=81972 RepID=D7LN09_ARALL|nr:hypothetical protein ARALYDRAFT_905839 [Arabidopsis lyrata subsp. lyrata]